MKVILTVLLLSAGSVCFSQSSCDIMLRRAQNIYRNIAERRIANSPRQLDSAINLCSDILRSCPDQASQATALSQRLKSLKVDLQKKEEESVASELQPLNKLNNPNTSKVADDIEKLESEKVVEEKFNKYLQQVKYPFAIGQKISNDVAANFINAGYFHAWALINHENYAEAERVMRYVIDNKNNIDTNAASILHALAGIYNGLSKLEVDYKHDQQKSLENSRLSVYYSRKAVAADKDNDRYRLRLSNNLRNNTQYDSVLLPKAERQRLAEESCEIAEAIIGKKNSKYLGQALEKSANCQIDRSWVLQGQNKYQQAIDELIVFSSKLDAYLKENSKESYLILKKIEVSTRIANIADIYLKDKKLHEKYLTIGVADFIRYLNMLRSTEVPLDLWFVAKAYTDLAGQNIFIEDDKKKLANYQLMQASLKALVEANIDVTELATIAIKNAMYISEVQLRIPKTDTALVLKTISEAIGIFEKTDIIKRYVKFSDDFESFARIYLIRIKINAARGQLENIKRDYQALWSNLEGAYKKYPFNYYLNIQLIKAAELYGKALFEQKKYAEAIKPLEFASYEGIKPSTDYLVDIYSTGEFKNKERSDSFSNRSSGQKDGYKKFTIPSLCDGAKTNLYVYVSDKAKGHPYKGIREQAEWFKVARGCSIPADVVESFDKLQEIAWQNNVSYQELCVYALNAAQNDSTSTRKNEGKTGSARAQEEFQARKKNVQALVEGGMPELMISYWNWYMIEKDRDRADSLLAIMLNRNSLNRLDKFNLKIKYTLMTRDSINSRLLASDARNPLQTAYYSSFMADSVLVNNNQRWANLYNVAAIDSVYHLSATNNDTIKRFIANIYNNLAWYSFLSNRSNRAMRFLNKSIALDPASVYPYGNIPHAYLFTGQFEKAKQLYLSYKNKPFNANYPTYKDALLADFDEFEKAGIMNDEIKEIVRLLNEK